MHDTASCFETVTPDSWLSNEQTWKENLLKLPNWYQIPLINSNASHNLPDGTLVRFRGMIQDMHNPEFYFEQFEVYNSETNEVRSKSGKYRDTANILENEKINYANNLQSAQRQTMVVVSMPGLSEWAQQLEDSRNHLNHLKQQPNSSKRLTSSIKLKRSYDETEDDVMEVEQEVTNKEPRSKEVEAAAANVVSREHLLNFPLPDVASQSCIVKVYTEDDQLKLNEMIEVVGFLSVDPSLSGEFQPETEPLINPAGESEVEAITHNPPPSLVPRLHAVCVRKLEHCNPLVEGEFDQNTVLKEANTAREHLLKALTELLLGDKLAAEYLICHLIACVYLRQETLTLGSFCLNISNLPTRKYPHYAKQLYDIIKQFVTKSYYLPLTVDNMNTMALLPKPGKSNSWMSFDFVGRRDAESDEDDESTKCYSGRGIYSAFLQTCEEIRKDYDCNRLTSGILQLSKHTHLILDETQMEQGRLDATGVHNIAALGSLIKTQKVKYDFKYYQMDFESDVSVLILSEGKSLLPSDYHVPLHPEESSLKIFDAIVEAATYYLKEEIMNLIRTYLTNLKLVKYTITEDLKFVEDDFIDMRRNSTTDAPVTADDLHRLLVLARLVSLSRGHDTLNKQCWDTAKAMEAELQHRLKNRVPSTK